MCKVGLCKPQIQQVGQVVKMNMSEKGLRTEDIIAVLYRPTADFKINREKSALLIVNFVDYKGLFTRIATEAGFPETEVDKVLGDFDLRARKAANNAGELLKFLRERGFEIFHVKSEAANIKKKTNSENRGKTGLTVRPEFGNLAFYEAVKPRKGELVFSQENLDAFTSTNLDFVLRNMNIDTLAICGLTTDQNVLFNTVQAVKLGYYVLVVEDACTTVKAEIHAPFIDWYKTFVNVKSTKEIISTIEEESEASSRG